MRNDQVFSSFVTFDDGLVLPPDPLGTIVFEGQAAGGVALFPSWVTFARASDQYTVQTSASTLVTGLTGSNVGYIGNRGGTLGKAWSNGLSFEEARTQVMSTNPRSVDALTSPGTATQTGGQSSPCGDSLAYRVQATSVQYSDFSAWSVSSGAYAISLWHKQGSGGALFQWYAYGTTPTTSTRSGGTAPSSWSRNVVVDYITTTTKGFVPCDGRDFFGSGGITAGSRDVVIDFMQLEAGKYATEAISTASAARAAPRLTTTDKTKLFTPRGKLYWEIDWTPSASPSAYPAAIQISPYLSATDAGASISNTTGRLSVTAGGVTWTPTTDLNLHIWAGRRVRIGIVSGGGELPRAMIFFPDNGTVLDLGTGTAPQPSYSLASGTVDLVGNNGSNIPSGLIHSINAWSAEPAWFSGITAPWLPSSLTPAAWFRSDLGVSLSTGVSALADQSGNNRNAAQLTGSKQPLYVAEAFNRRPGIRFCSASAQILTIVQQSISMSGDFTIWAVFIPAELTATSYRAVFGSRTAGGLDICSLITPVINSGNIAVSSAANLVTVGTIADTTNPILLGLRGTSGALASVTRFNSTTAAYTYTPATLGPEFSLGGIANGSIFSNLTLLECVILTRKASLAEEAAFLQYVNNAWAQGWTP